MLFSPPSVLNADGFWIETVLESAGRCAGASANGWMIFSEFLLQCSL